MYCILLTGNILCHIEIQFKTDYNIISMDNKLLSIVITDWEMDMGNSQFVRSYVSRIHDI